MKVIIVHSQLTIMLNYTSIMATMGTMNAAIAPSFDSIQQLLLYTVAYIVNPYAVKSTN